MFILTEFFSGSLKHLKVFPPISKFEEIDITKALTSRGRLHYPKIAKKSRLDEFLARRTHLKVLEERKLAQSVCSFNMIRYMKWNVCLKCFRTIYFKGAIYWTLLGLFGISLQVRHSQVSSAAVGCC